MRYGVALSILISLTIVSCGGNSDEENTSKPFTNNASIDSNTVKIQKKNTTKSEEESRPVDDITHIDATIIAKEFVVKKLNTSPTPTFDTASIDWMKLKNNFYQISSDVHAYDAYCVMKKYHWVVKLKYKSGDIEDLKNWSLASIKITE